MKLLEMFKEPINRKDLLSVIKQALFMSVVGGLLVGSIYLLIDVYIGIEFKFFLLFVFAVVLSRRMHEAYSIYHVLYSVVAILAVFLTYYLMHATYSSGIVYMTDSSFTDNLLYIFDPLRYFNFLNIFAARFLTVINLLDVFFFIVINIYIVRYLK